MAHTQPRIRILCVDDHPLVREGLIRKVEHQKDMKVVASAATGEEGIRLFKSYRPDVTLMDLNLPGISGLEAIAAIRTTAPDARIVVLTMYRGDENIHRALQAGAAAYVLKSALSDDLIRVVRQVHGGARPMSPDIASQLAARDESPTLTPRELGVIEQMARGMRNKEIAEELGISDETIEVHARKIFKKLGVRDRTAAVMTALRRGFLRLDE